MLTELIYGKQLNSARYIVSILNSLHSEKEKSALKNWDIPGLAFTSRPWCSVEQKQFYTTLSSDKATG